MATPSLPTFASLLRQHRLAAGLTQEDLAEHAGVSTRGIQDLERGFRQKPRPETVRLLAEALGLDAAARAALIAATLPAPPPTPLPAGNAGGPAISLPRLPVPPTTLLGRDLEMATATAALRPSGDGPAARLLTLTGPGGVGKTRLALAVADALADHFPNGVAWIDLTAVRNADAVAGTIGRGIGLAEDVDRDGLVRALTDRTLLLVLDNCEHLLPAMPLIAALLTACPRLAVLATSRTRLRLRGERELPVGPLALPDGPAAGAAALPALQESPAVRLFVERAADVHPGFALIPENAAAIAAICRRLDGLPLAIELAAARVKLLPPTALLARLEPRLPLLAGGARDLPPRQQTMRDAIAWSHDLMSGHEQVLFRRLAVFAGGFTLEAVEAVIEGERGKGGKGEAEGEGGKGGRGEGPTRAEADAADPWPADGSSVPSPFPPFPLSPLQSSTLEHVAALIDQSVVRPAAAAADEPRFTMLETVREYATEQLAASGEDGVVRDAHAAFFLDLAERAQPELRGPDQERWLARLAAEHDNLRAALAWTLPRDPRLALRLAAALGRFWRMHGHPREGLSWLEQALAGDAEEVTAARAAAQEEAGRLAHDLDDPEKAERLYAAALTSWQALGDPSGEARLLDDLGNIAHDRGEFARAVALHEEALARARAADDRRAAGRALNNLGMAALYQSRDDEALQHYAEALALMEELSDAFAVNVIRNNLGIVQIRREEWDTAAATFERCLAGCRALGDQRGIGGALVNLAEIRYHQGDPARAEALYERARQLFAELGDDRAAAAALGGLALVALNQGDPTRAAELLGTSLNLAHRIDDKLKIADGLEGLAEVAIAQGAAARAARLLGAADALRTRMAAPVPAQHRAAHERVVATTRAALAAERFAAAWAEGAAWPLETAINDATALAAALAEGAV